MDFESPDVAKDFPGLFASEGMKRSQSRDSEYSDEDKSRKDLLGKKKERKESKKDKGYVVFEGESSQDEVDEAKSPSKNKKNKTSAFKFPGKDKKDKSKSKDKDTKEKKDEKEKEKVCKKESKEGRKDSKEVEKIKVKKERKLLKIKDKKKKSVDQDVKEEKPIFGVPLNVAVERNKSYDGIELPVIVRECIDYIEEHGLACEGIYKISGLKSKVRNLKNQYNAGEKVYLYEHEPHIIASLLKQFLRDLPEPILTSALAPKFEEAGALKNEQKRLETLQKLFNDLPNCNRILLSWVFVHMQHVMALERRNKMNLQNVSIVLSPTMQMSHNVLQAFFSYADVLFKGVELKKYVPPIELDSTRLSLELPDSPSAIADELSKQENFLNVLHAELNTGLRDQQKEEKLWEIQRIVTQLKRKLRFLKQLEDTSAVQIEVSNLKCMLPNVANVVNTESEVFLSDVNTSPTNSKKLKEHSSVEAELPQVANITDSAHCEVPETENSVITEQVQQDSENNKELKDDNTEINEKEQGSTRSPIQYNIEGKHEDETSVVSEIDGNVQDFASSYDASEESDESLQQLVREEKMLKIEYDELLLLRDELKRKISSEELEIDRLKVDINEYQQLYKYKRYAFDSTENSSSESDDSSASDCEDEEEDLSTVLDSLMKKNRQLESLNKEVTKTIQCEREICLNVKIQMKMLHAT